MTFIIVVVCPQRVVYGGKMVWMRKRESPSLKSSDQESCNSGSQPPRTTAQETTDEQAELLRLASVVAHQLRSPLNAVQTVLGSVLGGFVGPLEPRQRWLLEKAWQRCSGGIDLVRALMRLRTVDQLDMQALGPVDVAAKVSMATAAIRDAAAEKELDLISQDELVPGGRAWVLADPDLVGEIISVLLENAVKYTPAGGQVATRLFLAEKAGHQQACVEVKDTGIGIPPEGYEYLFREFYRAPNAKQMAAEGAGLGLAFAWRATVRLGGVLELKPADEGGTRALLTLPLRRDLEEGALQAEQDVESMTTAAVHRVVVIGGVTAGSKAAAKIMRLDPDADVTIVEKGRFLAYSGCGLPYYISGAVAEQRALLETPLGLLRDLAFFHQLKNVRAMDLTEAIKINCERKTVAVRVLLSGQERQLPYDTLILATGTRPLRPDLPGVNLPGVHTLQGVEDAEAIRARLRARRALDVVIVGGGLLGCQVAEAVSLCGARLTLVESRSRLMVLWDPELSSLIRRHLERNGVRVLLGNGAADFEGEDRVRAVRLEDGTRMPCDFVLLTAGREPETGLARDAGLEIAATGAIGVDETLRTSDPAIFAVGDCAESRCIVTGRPLWSPGAATASLEGRVAAVNACGGEERFPGSAGTVIVKVFDGTAARTGLTEEQAREAGFDPVTSVVPGPDRAHFVPTARAIIVKLVVDRVSRRVLGAQGVGLGEVAKRIDVVATAIMAKMDVDSLAHLHLSYAPPYSMALDNVITAANVVRNKLAGYFQGVSSPELWQLMQSDDPPFLLDVRQPAEYGRVRFRNSQHIPLGSLRGRMHELSADQSIVLVCSIGLRSYEAALILGKAGFTDVRVLDGGLDAWPFAVESLD